MMFRLLKVLAVLGLAGASALALADAQAELESCVQAALQSDAGKSEDEARADCRVALDGSFAAQHRQLIVDIQAELEQRAIEEGRIMRMISERREQAVSEVFKGLDVTTTFSGPPVTYTRSYSPEAYAALPELDASVVAEMSVKITQMARDDRHAYLLISVPEMPKGYLVTDLTVHASPADCGDTKRLRDVGKVAIEAHYHNLGRTPETADKVARIKVDESWAPVACVETIAAKGVPILPAAPESAPVEQAAKSQGEDKAQLERVDAHADRERKRPGFVTAQ